MVWIKIANLRHFEFRDHGEYSSYQVVCTKKVSMPVRFKFIKFKLDLEHLIKWRKHCHDSDQLIILVLPRREEFMTISHWQTLSRIAVSASKDFATKFGSSSFCSTKGELKSIFIQPTSSWSFHLIGEK